MGDGERESVCVCVCERERGRVWMCVKKINVCVVGGELVQLSIKEIWVIVFPQQTIVIT